jgi:precorrin-2 dehydrogenase/sirohydrochlorin ferrochelatase
VTVIAPHLCEELQRLQTQIQYLPRVWQTGDTEGYHLIFACTDVRAVNAQVATEAQANNIWCNIADDATASDFHGAATVRSGDICIGISTGGGSPALARHLKAQVQECIGEEYALLLEILEARRAKLDELVPLQNERAELWRSILASDVLALLRAGQHVEAEQKVDELMARR